MKRKITRKLEAWKNSDHRKPLVVMGARQVGKTYSVLEFGHANYAAVLHVDFAEHPDLSRLFSGGVEPERLVRLLGEYFSTRVDPETTLLFFDEVQRCPEAITSLKYFCESAPEYDVIAADSLLGTTVRQRAGLFPVGKVDLITMRPLDFEEYLWALGHEDLADLIREASRDSRAFALHDRCMELYRRYLLVGGMPEPLSLWIAQGRMDVVRRTQENIATGYLADITQYTEGLDGAMVLAAWRSMPRQLAKDNTKFQYSAIRSGARSKTYAPCIEWLKDAGLVEPVTHITDAVRPLEAFAEDNNFKLYLLDTGLLSSLYRARMEDVLPQGDKAAVFRGGLTENYVCQQLVAAGIKPYYWGVASKSEVEFVFETRDGRVIPVEVKSGKNVGAKSVRSFADKYEVPYVVKVTAKNFGFENGVRNLPLYAAFTLDEDADA